MLDTTIQNGHGPSARDAGVQGELARLRIEYERLRIEYERVCAENRHLRVTLDGHVARATSTALFGPMEMTAGTAVGPRRRDRAPSLGGCA
jgi:hypothetical protein